MTHTLDYIMYFSVLTRETVYIALTMAALHDLKVKTADILNAYLMASNREKIWTLLGPEFGNNAGTSAVIVMALYGLKSAVDSFRARLE